MGGPLVGGPGQPNRSTTSATSSVRTNMTTQDANAGPIKPVCRQAHPPSLLCYLASTEMLFARDGTRGDSLIGRHCGMRPDDKGFGAPASHIKHNQRSTTGGDEDQ